MSARIVFMGSPAFALPSLSALAKKYKVAGVVTQPDRAAGRGRELTPSPVKTLALELNLPIIQPEKLRDGMPRLREWNPDLIVVAAFGQILRRETLDLPAYGCVNVHASLLPRWRGAAPVQAAILADDAETGVTIMKMDEGLDTGPMLAAKSIPIGRNDTAGAVLEALSALGADLLLETLPAYLAGTLKPAAQPQEGATCAPALKKEDGLLDFNRPAAELERRVRAMNPWPCAWFAWKGNPLKVLRASVLDKSPAATHGTRLVVGGTPAIQTSEGALVLEEVQPAGKKVMPGKSFLAGARDWLS